MKLHALFYLAVLDGSILREKALEIAECIGCDGSNGLFDRWKKATILGR